MSLEQELARLANTIASAAEANSAAVQEIIRQRDQALKERDNAQWWRNHYEGYYGRECETTHKLRRTITGLRGALGREKARRLRAEGKED